MSSANCVRNVLLVARALSLALSSLSCLICNAHTPCVPSSAKSICWLARTFLKLFFTKHFVVVPPQNLPLWMYCRQPWPSLWHLVSCTLSHWCALSVSASPSPFLSQPFTHSLHWLLWVCLCLCVCIWRLCVYNQRSYSRCLLAVLPAFLPLCSASISCLIFMFLLYFCFFCVFFVWLAAL